MKHTVFVFALATLLSCQEDEFSSDISGECVSGEILSSSACTGSGVIISVHSENRSIIKALEQYSERREITVFSTESSGVEVGDQISFRMLELVDTARVCLMLWESPRGPEAKISLDCL